MWDEIAKGMIVKNTNFEVKAGYKEYYNNFLVLTCLGLIWLAAAGIGHIDHHLSILLLFVGFTFFQTMVNVIRKMVKISNLNENNPSRTLSTCIMIGVPAGMIVGFFPFTSNINMFFPIFTVLFGLIFSVIGFMFKLKSYVILAVILIAGGAYIGYAFEGDFKLAGYYAGGMIIGFGIVFRVFAVLCKRACEKNPEMCVIE
jgi:hypothetical protein